MLSRLYILHSAWRLVHHGLIVYGHARLVYCVHGVHPNILRTRARYIYVLGSYVCYMVALTSTKQRAAHIAAVPPPGTRSCSRPRSRCRPEGEEPVRACSIGRPLQWMAAASARRSLPSTGRHAKTVHGTSSKCVVVLIPSGGSSVELCKTIVCCRCSFVQMGFKQQTIRSCAGLFKCIQSAANVTVSQWS